jgi:hypothetical protein
VARRPIGPLCAIAHQQREAIARREAGEALTDIARTFGVSHTTIGRLTSSAPTMILVDRLPPPDCWARRLVANHRAAAVGAGPRRLQLAYGRRLLGRRRGVANFIAATFDVFL